MRTTFSLSYHFHHLLHVEITSGPSSNHNFENYDGCKFEICDVLFTSCIASIAVIATSCMIKPVSTVTTYDTYQ